VNVRTAHGERASPLHWLVVLTLAGAATIHADQIGVHLEEWLPAGLTFIGLALVQAALAAGIVLRPSRSAYAGAVLVSALTVALWGISRTTGLPFGPQAGQPETVGRPDLVASTLEVVTATAGVGILAGIRPAASSFGRGIMVSFVAALGLTIGFITWAAVTAPEEASHGEPNSVTGPLEPVDGHSLLSRDTATVELPVGEHFGLVVGLLPNDSEEPFVILAARAINLSGNAVRHVRFWVLPGNVAAPGVAVPLCLLRDSGQHLPGDALVPPGRSPSVLVLEMRAIREGDYILSAVEVTYEAGGTSYEAPFATIARVQVSPAT
jgi:hypothetical protein